MAWANLIEPWDDGWSNLKTSTRKCQGAHTAARRDCSLGFLVAADTKIFRGSMVFINTSGYAFPGPPTLAEVFVGTATSTVDNFTGANGDKPIRVMSLHCRWFKHAGAEAADVGSTFEADEDADPATVRDYSTGVPIGRCVAHDTDLVQLYITTSALPAP